MVRIAKKADPRRLQELKRKINNEEYMALAISKIAQELTKRFASEG